MNIEITMDCESEIVTKSLQGYHDIMLHSPEDREEDILKALEVVLSHYMTSQDYKKWHKSVYDKETGDDR